MKYLEICLCGLILDLMRIVGEIKISNIVVRLIWVICAFVYFLCFFDFIVSKYEEHEEITKNKETPKDTFTIKMIVGVLNMIYLVFCIIQIKSLFMRNVDINYANYARQGFFQLMIVSVLNLVTILMAKRQDKKSKYIQVMSSMMILFTFILLLSAAIRMYFYESAYGYTLLRLLVYCVLFTEAILLIPTILYSLNKKINLPKVYFSILVVIYVGMNFANFNYVISKRNVERYAITGKIDISYLKYETGTDGIEPIISLMDMENGEQELKDEVKEYASKRYKQLSEEKVDFRNFNISKWRAKKLCDFK